MGSLVATRSVMTLAGRAGDLVRFEAYDEESGFLRRRVALMAFDWMDMGCPQVVTVTVEPGDLLNGSEGLEA